MAYLKLSQGITLGNLLVYTYTYNFTLNIVSQMFWFTPFQIVVKVKMNESITSSQGYSMFYGVF